MAARGSHARRSILILLAIGFASGCTSASDQSDDAADPMVTPRAPVIETVGQPDTPFTIAPRGTHVEDFRLAPDQTVTVILDLRQTSENGLTGCVFDKEQYERFEERRSFTGYACHHGWAGETGQDQISGGSEYPGKWYYLGIRCGDDRYECAGEFTLRLVEN